MFIQGSGLPQLLAAQGEVHVLEVGLGTGLNFCATAAVASALGARLHYTAIEPHPVPPDILLEYYRQLGRWQEWLPWLRGQTPATHAIGLQVLAQPWPDASVPAGAFHVLFHDAFAPRVAPELWGAVSAAAFTRAAAPGAVLVTYSVHGSFRRALQAQGWTVQRLPGAAGKRQMLRASKA